MKESKKTCKRRKFLQYALASTATTMALGWLFAEGGSSESKNNSACSFSDSNCQKDLAGVTALDGRGNPIELSAFLKNVPPKKPVAVKGLSQPIYIVVENGPEIAPYGILPVCTHRPNRLRWRSDLDRFVCANHGARFDYRGKVTRGPARRDLKLVKVFTQDEQIKLIDR